MEGFDNLIKRMQSKEESDTYGDIKHYNELMTEPIAKKLKWLNNKLYKLYDGFFEPMAYTTPARSFIEGDIYERCVIVVEWHTAFMYEKYLDFKKDWCLEKLRNYLATLAMDEATDQLRKLE